MHKTIPASVIATALLVGISFNASATKIQFGMNPQTPYSAVIIPKLMLSNGSQVTWMTNFLNVSGQGRTTQTPSVNSDIPQNGNPATWSAVILSQYQGSTKSTVCTVSNIPSPTNKFGGDASFTAWFTYHVTSLNGQNYVDKCWVSNSTQ